jgi:hypothetical protein
MSIKTLIRHANDDDFTDSIRQEAEDVILKVTDTVDARTRPTEIDEFYVETEYDHRADGQRKLFTALGEEHSSDPQATAAKLAPRAETVGSILESRFEVYKVLLEQRIAAEKALRPFVRRTSGRLIYYGFMGGFLLGDIAGIGGAQILLGEIPELAIIQAIAAASATVVAGFVGRDLRDIERHRYRTPNGELPDELKPYAHKLRGRHSGEKVTRLMVVLAAVVAIIIGIAIFALRASVNGPLVGMIYGAIAVAIAGGSALNSWAYTDDVADLLNSHQKVMKEEEADLDRRSKDPDVQAKLAAEQKAQSIKTQYVDLAAAAEEHMWALKEMILRENPHIAGHGRLASQQPLITNKQLAAWANNDLGPTS